MDSWTCAQATRLEVGWKGDYSVLYVVVGVEK